MRACACACVCVCAYVCLCLCVCVLWRVCRNRHKYAQAYLLAKTCVHACLSARAREYADQKTRTQVTG